MLLLIRDDGFTPTNNRSKTGEDESLTLIRFANSKTCFAVGDEILL